MSLEWRGSGAVGDGIVISTLTAVALPMVAREGGIYSYYHPLQVVPVATNTAGIGMGSLANSVQPYYSTIGGVVSTIANPSGAVLPLTTTANLTQPYFTK